MARGTLHSSKPEDQRRRRNKPAHSEHIDLQRDGETRGPELFDVTLKADWSPFVEAWYDRWRKSPQAQAFEETDWQRLGMIAYAVAAYEKRPSATMLGEIRMNEERLGATVTDRMRARMRIEDDDSESAPVLQMADKKKSIADRMKQ